MGIFQVRASYTARFFTFRQMTKDEFSIKLDIPRNDEEDAFSRKGRIVERMGMSFDEIKEKYEPMIKKQLTALNIYQNYEDFYQVGVIGLWDAYRRFDPNKGSFGSFAMKTVRGNMLMHLTKEARYKERQHLVGGVELFERVGVTEDRALELELFTPYIENLTPREKLWVIETFLYDKKPSDIASEQKVSINSVKTWRSSALRKLRLQFSNTI